MSCVKRNEKQMAQSKLRIVLGTWDKLHDDAMVVRRDVFIVEQSVPEDIELDNMDAVSLHAVAYADDGSPVGTGRLLPDGHIGRMAVRRHARGAKIGTRLLQALIKQARQLGHRQVALHAQSHARGFYEAHDFYAQGPTFIEANIPHLLMLREL